MSDVESILSQLREAIKAEVREEVRAELIAELGGKSAAPKRGKPGPKPKARLANDSAFRTGAERAMLPKVKPGQRRTEADIQAAGFAIQMWLKKNPESRADQIAAAFKAPVKDLQRPIAWLLSEKKVTKKGQLRGTKYSVKG